MTLQRDRRHSADLERYVRVLAEYRRRDAKFEHTRVGYYDDDGVRQGGLIAFVRYFWHILEPETPFVDGWVLWAMCEHLEAVTAGKITRLLINVPPGFMKSLLTDVFWPAWEWGPMGLSHLRYVCFSYAASLTERDNGRFRDLVMSPDFQALYADQVKIVKKGDGRVSNLSRGWKFASSVSGVGTGERGDRVILDDPHNVKEAESETVRNETVRWFRESMSSRLNDLQRGAIVIIMQRVHEDDVSGAVLTLGLGYCHFCVPMEYEWDRQTGGNGDPVETQIGWVDPRYLPMAPDECDGVNAWPERFPPDVIVQTKQAIGPYAWAGQYQQTPTPRGGGIFQRAWWQPWESTDNKYPVFEYLLASLDSAYTEKEENDPSALTIWGVFRNKEDRRRIMLVTAWRKHLQFSADRSKLSPLANEDDKQRYIRAPDGGRATNPRYMRWLRRTQEHWGLMEWVVDSCKRFDVHKLLIEAKASGISAAQELANRFGQQPWSIQLCKVVGDKYSRALSAQPTFSQRMVYAPLRDDGQEWDWATMVMDEMAVFPKGKYKDLTDSSTQAIKHLRDIGMAQTDDEAHVAEIEVMRPRAHPKALYPV